MLKSIIKTVINAAWVALVGLLLCQVLQPSKVLGYSLFSIYAAVLLVFKPMKDLFNAVCKPDINIPVERQAPNKIYSLILLSIKVLLLIACMGMGVSGVVLYRIIFLKSLAMKLHLLFSYWIMLLSAVQLGVNIGITVLPKTKDKIQKGAHFASLIGSVIGIVFLLQSRYPIALFILNENPVSFSGLQTVALVIGFISMGMAVNHFLKKTITLKGYNQ